MAILKNVKVGASSHRDIEKSLGLILYPHSSAYFILGKPEGWDLTWLCLPERHLLQIKQRQICVSRGSPSSNIAHMYHLSCALCCAVRCSVVSGSFDPIACQAPLSRAILQARILGWVAMPCSRGSFQSRDQTQVYHIAGEFFPIWTTREAQEYWSGQPRSPGELANPGIKLGSPALQMDSLPAELPGKPMC